MTDAECRAFVRTDEYRRLFAAFEELARETQERNREVKTALFTMRLTDEQIKNRATGMAFGMMRAYMLLVPERLDGPTVERLLLDASR